MKKNIFSEKKKSPKGFYAALGISAVMIGSACFFAYDQGQKLTEEFRAQTESEAPVGGRVTGIPKPTAPPVRATTAAPSTLAAMVTAPPRTTTAAPVIAIEPEEAQEANAEPVEELAAAAVGLEDVKPPLADMSSILEPFSGRDLVKNETTGSWQTHNGTDIAAEVGAEVFAVSAGEISAVISDPLWGVTVELDHKNGFVTRYCSLAADLCVQQGDTVSGGDLIGTVGDTADIESALAPHLHIEVLHNGTYIDPIGAFRS
ncbi:MAG: peptidoglycan DD-metalloendopeptidase family protein [Ruminococcus sp.]|nr:peptidoglycan DD-metalloendopeptidase family protein [Ruminococcus sp.]